MPWPSVRNFGIVDNPLIDSPYNASSNQGGGNQPPSNGFLLLNGGNFLLLNGTDLLLLS